MDNKVCALPSPPPLLCPPHIPMAVLRHEPATTPRHVAAISLFGHDTRHDMDTTLDIDWATRRQVKDAHTNPCGSVATGRSLLITLLQIQIHIHKPFFNVCGVVRFSLQQIE